ncbi:aspartate kinase [Candidatus Bathyarchaeota archaeon]|nr:aspartate kinase [Candidatus Bathyarchaeota archaeon]
MSKLNKIIVVKFGGSSLASSNQIVKAACSIIEAAKKGFKPVVVVSAMGKSTDQLLEIARETIKNKKNFKELLDDILSMGERTSARIFSAALKANGANAKYFDPLNSDWPIVTDDAYGNAKPILEECIKKIKQYVHPILNQNIIPVIPGFIGKTSSGEITTIGRGGSDTTAFILAQALNADEVVLVTDVKGIMTGDPKLVKDPKPLDVIPIQTLAGLADSGAKFIHKKALKYKPENIDVKVISYEAGTIEAKGTIIKGGLVNELLIELFPKPMLMVTVVGKGVSEEPSIIKGIIEEIKARNIDLIGTSSDYNSLIFYLPEENVNGLLNSIHEIVKAHEEALAMAVKKNLALIQITGVGLEETPGVIGKISIPLHDRNINIYGIFTITSSIKVLVEWSDKDEALTLIKNMLKEED